MKKALFIPIFLLCGAFFAQESGYLIKNYTPKDYNGFSQIWSIAQDSTGTMYFGSSTNIITFNGGNWDKIFVQAGVPIRSLARIKNRIYVGLQGDFGLIEYDSRKKPHFKSLKFLLNESQKKIADIWKIHEWNGYVVFQTSERILLLKDNAITSIEPETTFALSFCQNNRLYVRQRQKGMMELGADLKLQMIKGGELFADLPVTGWVEGRENKRTVVSSSSEGLLFYDAESGKTKQLDKKNESLIEFTPLTLSHNADNTWFISGRGGFIHADENLNIITHFNKANGLNDDAVTSSYISADGNLWLGLNNGISVLEWNSDGVYMGQSTGIKGGAEQVVLYKGNYYVATSDNIYKGPYTKTEQHKVKFQPVFSDISEHWDLKIHRGKLLSASTSGTYDISEKTPIKIHNRWTRYLLSAGEECPYLISLEKGSFSVIKNDATPQVVRTFPFEGEEFLHGLFLKKANGYELWMASINGIFWKLLLSENLNILSTRKYGEANGIKNAQKNVFCCEGEIIIIGNGKIHSYKPELDKNVSSLCFISDNKFPYQKLNKKTAQFDDDFAGRIWPSNYNYSVFFRKTGKELYEIIPYTLRQDPSADVSQYTTDDSLRSWFMGSDFLIYLKRYRDVAPHICYPVNITFSQHGKDSSGIYYTTPPKNSFSYKNNSITFEYAAPFFTEPEKTRYRCKLIGTEDSSWTKWSTTRHKEYTNLHEGDYIFMVQAQNIYEDPSEITRFSFTILPPWYRTWWAYLLYVVSLVVLVYTIVRLSIYRLRQSKLNLEKIVNERTHELQEKKKEITDSIKYALRIQTAILPSEHYVKHLLNDHFIFYRPKDIVSGDFYWVEEIRGKSLFAAVDCTGHGVPGAMMSVIGLKLLNSAVNDRRLDMPSDILNYLDKGVHDTLRQGEAGNTVRDGMDLALCAWDKAAGILEYAGVFNSLWLVRKNVAGTWRIKNEKEVFFGEHLLEIKSDKMHIGSNKDHKGDQYTNHYIKLLPGDCVYIYSDGYADQFGGPNGKKFKYNKLKELLVANAHLPMEEQQKILANTFDAWKGSQEQVDDVLVMGLKF